jgi:imidazolonepropionase
VPLAGLQTRDTSGAHYRRLRAAGATIALATDCNPGTAWGESMPLAVQLACWLWGMPVEAALRAATLGGAAALRRTDVGHLAVGARGDLLVLAASHEHELAVHLGGDAVTTTVVGGVPTGGA